MEEIVLKKLAQRALGTLCVLSLARSPTSDYIGDALRAVQDAETIMMMEERPRPAVARLASIHSIALASREVADLEMATEAARFTIARWLEPNAGKLQELPATAWRNQADELARAVVHTRQALEEAAASLYCASTVISVATDSWLNFPMYQRKTWMRDAKLLLTTVRDHLKDAIDGLAETRACVTRTKEAAKLLIDLL